MKKITSEELELIEVAKTSLGILPPEISEKISGIISDNSAKNLICCRYYDLGSFRYARTSSQNCKLVAGDVVDDSFCG